MVFLNCIQPLRVRRQLTAAILVPNSMKDNEILLKKWHQHDCSAHIATSQE
jgi:hypothetical protein